MAVTKPYVVVELSNDGFRTLYTTKTTHAGMFILPAGLYQIRVRIEDLSTPPPMLAPQGFRFGWAESMNKSYTAEFHPQSKIFHLEINKNSGALTRVYRGIAYREASNRYLALRQEAVSGNNNPLLFEIHQGIHRHSLKISAAKVEVLSYGYPTIHELEPLIQDLNLNFVTNGL